MNDENLIPLSKRTQREKRKIQKKGNETFKKNNEIKKNAREVIKDVLYSNLKLPELKKMVNKMDIYKGEKDKNNLLALVISVFVTGVKKGDSRILKDLIELAGEKPAEKIEITSQDSTILEIQEYLSKKRIKNEWA